MLLYYVLITLPCPTIARWTVGFKCCTYCEYKITIMLPSLVQLYTEPSNATWWQRCSRLSRSNLTIIENKISRLSRSNPTIFEDKISRLSRSNLAIFEDKVSRLSRSNTIDGKALSLSRLVSTPVSTTSPSVLTEPLLFELLHSQHSNSKSRWQNQHSDCPLQSHFPSINQKNGTDGSGDLKDFAQHPD